MYTIQPFWKADVSLQMTTIDDMVERDGHKKTKKVIT